MNWPTTTPSAQARPGDRLHPVGEPRSVLCGHAVPRIGRHVVVHEAGER